MSAQTLNNLLNKFVAAEFRHAAILAAHLVLMFHHGPSEVTPLEDELKAGRCGRTELHVSRAL